VFRQLAALLQTANAGQGRPLDYRQAALQVFGFHPAELGHFVEAAWTSRAFDALHPSPPYPPRASLVLEIRRLGERLGVPGCSTPGLPEVDSVAQCVSRTVVWDHLIYAYLVENTRIYEIFARVLREFHTGETLQIPEPATQLWARTTEELFFRDAAPFGVYSTTSWLRRDLQATRCNAYYRMFGLDLNHGTEAGTPYPYVKPAAANRQFVSTFEEFLREVWRGIENARNQSGANTTDNAAIANLARSLQDMLTARRGGTRGALSREEFVAVAAMSWFHLTIEFDSPVVQDLRAGATSPDERLRRIGERVGLPAHSRTTDYLRLAPAMSRILWAIEAGFFSTPATVPVLYTPSTVPANRIRADMETVITHWSIATGHDIKARRVTVSGREVAAAVAPVVMASNGHASRPPSETFVPVYR
jgi:hypothetical protein